MDDELLWGAEKVPTGEGARQPRPKRERKTRKTAAAKKTILKRPARPGDPRRVTVRACPDSSSAASATVGPRLLHGKDVLEVGSDCCGWLSEGQALQALRIPHRHVFASDKSKHVKQLVDALFEVDMWFEDIFDPGHANAPACDLYVAGFPCQPFSLAGARRGVDDLRGIIIYAVYRYLSRRRPRCFLLENVSGITMGKHKEIFASILSLLESIKHAGSPLYHIYSRVLDTKLHGGLPQSRPRLFIVGVQADVDRGNFAWPQEVPCKSLINVVEPLEDDSTRTSTGVKDTQKTRLRNLTSVVSRVPNAWTLPIIIDTDQGISGTTPYMLDMCPCITASRGQSRGFFYTKGGYMLTVPMMISLQGADPSRFADTGLSERQLGSICGNAMTISVVERILVRLLPAAGLCSQLRDRYQ